MTSQDKLKELEVLISKKQKIDAEYISLKNEKYAEIDIIENKYEKELSLFSTTISEYNEKIDCVRKEKNKLEIEEEWQEAINRGEINEFYLCAMLKKCKLNNLAVDIKLKKKLDNNIIVWMITSYGYSPYKFYLAFYNNALVGVSYRETSKHAGDKTEPYSFIGQFDKPLMKTKVRKYGDEKYETNATFTVWMNEISNIDVESINLIPMNKNTLKEIETGVCNYWNYYGWMNKN